MTGNFMTLFPLQISATDFNWSTKPKTSIMDLIVVFAIIAVIVGVVLIFNSRKGPTGKRTVSGAGGTTAGGVSGILAIIALHRIAKNLGLDREQTKMLDFIFKTDQVMDPEKSINTPDLLDRHFRRAYRLFEQTHGNESEIQRKLAVLFATRNIIENSVLDVMNSTRQIKDDTKFTIIYNKDKIETSVVSAKGDYLEVEAVKNALGSVVKIQKGTRLTVLFFSKNNKGFSFETRVAGYASKDGHPVMQLAHSGHVRFLSQRRYRRRQTAITCILFLVIVEGKGKKQHLIADKRKLQGSIADISVGGCSIKVLNPIKVGAMFKVEFQVTDMNLVALGQILRTNRTGMNTIVHMKFLKLSKRSMNAINSYVYEYSRE